jgi:cyclophilin family peptidyl-prolyl cis-trans isomerase
MFASMVSIPRGRMSGCVRLVLVLSGLVTALSLSSGQNPELHPAVPARPEPKPQVLLETNLGDILLELEPEKAPVTVANFLHYVETEHYHGTIFHRVIDNFVIQGGGYNEKMEEQRTRPPIRNESRNQLSNVRGTIAMARRHQETDSATCQFFININDNRMLDPQGERDGYAVFGKVVKGMEVVDRIRAVRTADRNGLNDVPLEPVVIKSAQYLNKPKAK